jgi:hypothetical protein
MVLQTILRLYSELSQMVTDVVLIVAQAQYIPPWYGFREARTLSAAPSSSTSILNFLVM